MKALLLALLLGVATLAAAKTPETVAIKVVNTDASNRQYSYVLPGTNSTSTTNCNDNGSATTIGTMTTANGTMNCETTTTPGTPARTVYGSIAQNNVHAILPNGIHVTLWCQAGFRLCGNLLPGDYAATIKGNSVFMNVFDLGGKEHKIKYHAIGSW